MAHGKHTPKPIPAKMIDEKDYQSLEQYFFERNAQIHFVGAVMIIACSLFWICYDALNGHPMHLNTMLSITSLSLMIASSAHILAMPLICSSIRNFETRMRYSRISHLVHYLILMYGICILGIVNNRLIAQNIVNPVRNYSVPLSAAFLFLIAAAPLASKLDSLFLAGMAIFSIVFPCFSDGAKAYNLPAHIVLYVCMFFAYFFFYRQNEEGYYTHQSLLDHRISLSRANVITNLFLETYDAVYYVDMKQDFFEIYRTSKHVKKYYDNLTSFCEFARKYIENDVLESDRASLLHLLDYAYIREQLQSGKQLLVGKYSDISSGKPRYHEIMIVSAGESADNQQIAVSVTDRDDAVRTEQARQRQLQQAIDIANQDPLTHVKSRAAFSDMQKQIDGEIAAKHQDEFAVVVCDINGLKETNDQLGHEAGDSLIIACSRTICSMFPHSPVYRIGGDEFTVLLTGRDYSQREKILKKISAFLESKEAKAESISFATGLAVYEPQKDRDFQSVFVRADAMMYERKREMKKGLPIR